MKRIFFLSIIIFCSFQIASAQLLWKVNGNGLQKSSYIFGTHYLIPMAYLDSVQQLYKAFNNCNTVICELVANNIDANAQLSKTAFIQGNKTLKDFIPVNKYIQVDSVLKSELKIGLKELSKMQPEFVLKMYEIELLKKIIGIYDDAQSDAYFQLVANERGMKVIGLETIQQQVKPSSDDQVLQKQCDQLTKTVLNKDSLSKEMIKISMLYKKGKIEDFALLSRMDGISNSETSTISKTETQNAAWIEKLTILMKEKPCFIVVGVEHLGGDIGLIESLRRKGYRVKAVE